LQVWIERAVFIVLAAVAGFVAARLHLPLPWMIGPLLMTTVYGLAGYRAPFHRFYRPVGQLIVATAVGLNFTPEAFAALQHDALLMVGAAVLTILAGFVTALMLRWMAKVDGTVAFFAAMPGGPNEMAVLAERLGAPGAPVVFSQTLRIVFIVLLIPAVLVVSRVGEPIELSTEGIDWGELLVLYGLAALGTFALRRMGVPNCNFLGPLAVAALISVTGLELSTVPPSLLAFGQIILGIALGSMFTREQISRDRKFAVAAVATTFVLLGQCAAVAFLLWLVGDKTFGAYLLATAPGSVTEMALTAKLLQQGVAMVTAYHLVRIFIIIPLAPLLYRAFKYAMQRHIEFEPSH
jgi:membrane AbrB-like protein